MMTGSSQIGSCSSIETLFHFGLGRLISVDLDITHCHGIVASDPGGTVSGFDPDISVPVRRCECDRC